MKLRISLQSPPNGESRLPSREPAPGTWHAQRQNEGCRAHSMNVSALVASSLLNKIDSNGGSKVQQHWKAIGWLLYLFLAQSGLKCTVRQMAPPRYIFAVLPSRDGILISGAVVGYVAGMSKSKSNSYLINSWMYQHFPDQCVPSLLDVMVNQSESVLLFIWIYLMRACSSCTVEWTLQSALHTSR